MALDSRIDSWSQEIFPEHESVTKGLQLLSFSHRDDATVAASLQEIKEGHHSEWQEIFKQTKAKRTNTPTITSVMWSNTMLRLEGIFQALKSDRPIDSDCDNILLTLMNYSESLPEKNFDFVLVVSLQTYINEARVLYKVDKPKAYERLERALQIIAAAEDARRAAEELGLEPVKLKKIDEFNDRPIYTI